MAYGLLSTGFAAKTLEVQRAEMNADIASRIGASLNTTDKSRLGKIIGIVAERITEVWELAELVYILWDPDSSTGEALAQLAAITGTLKEGATPSTVTLTLTGIAGSAVPTVGARVAVTSTAFEFVTLEASPATFTAVTAWSGAEAVVAGDRRRSNSAGIDRVYQCTSAGTTHASIPPTAETGAVTNGTATFAYLGRGTGAVDFQSQAALTGPVIAVARDITTIRTPSLDWLSVINIEAAVTGQNVETDEDLRVRREDEMGQLGSSPVDAIRADLLHSETGVDGVTNVTVFHNVTDVTDADGVPPHSVEALITGGLTQDIVDKLLDSVAAGIRTHGDITGTATDDAGNDHEIKFSRPDEIEIYVDIVLKKDDDYPSNGDQLVKDKIVARGNALNPGRNVVATQVAAWVYEITGVHDVNTPEISFSPSPGFSTTLSISSREIAKFDTARITVVSTTGVP